MKYIILFNCFLPAVVFSSENTDLCPSSFSNHREFIRVFFAEPQNRNLYRGQEGYIKFVEKYLSSLKMTTVFNYAVSDLSKDDVENLNWQRYQGTTKEFRKERSRILDENGNIKEEYQDLEGYARYADEFYGGDRKEFGNMQKAYMNVSAVLSESEKKSLNWQKYQGTTKGFRKERSRILDEEGNIKKEYQDLEGYARYADEFYGGNRKEFGAMEKAYKNVSAVLSESEKKSLNWQAYQGTTKEFREERSRILDEKGNIKKEYKGQENYPHYADEFYGGDRKEFGDMLKAYKNVSAVLSESEKKNLNWKQYKGTTEEFREERSRILDENGNIKEEYKGQENYPHYADEFYGGDRKEFGAMEKTYKNVSAVLSESEKKNLNWKQYKGTTKGFREERSRILDENGNIKEEYQDLEGHARYADEFYGGDRKEFGAMQKTYMNVSTVLSKEEMKNLGWKSFVGDTGQLHALLEFFKNHDFKDYKGTEGQKKTARMIFKDHLKNTYMNVSTLRGYLFKDENEFKELRESGWSVTLSW